MTTTCGFELTREQDFPEFNSHARLYRHVKTGAELLAISNDDENKAFVTAFRTLPSDDSGVPHILEHSVLGGSRKYPVKEPFVELLKSSLATFINAFTRHDSTLYPVASQNLQDFYNLMDVYLDALFAPTLTRKTFEQEGWHLETESSDAPLAYRGIVFNEMKGVISDPEYAQMLEGLAALFPNTVYGRFSGGNPKKIPDLSYEQFKAFYNTFYHPSNALFLLYGDLPVEEAACRIDAALANFEAAPPAPQVTLQPRFPSPRRVTAPYVARSADGRPKAYVTVSWLMMPNDDPAQVLSADILDYALTGSPAAPLRVALIGSGLGEELTGVPSGGARELVFSIGLKGVAPENAGKVEALILDTLAALARNGLDPATVEAAVNTTEFRLRENEGYGGQRGIALMTRALDTWLYGGDPFLGLGFERPLAQVKAALQRDPGYFAGMIREYLLDNPHRLTLVMEPDTSLLQRREAEEHDRLARLREAMSAAEAQAVVENTRELRALQQAPNSPEALATLPILRRSDLDPAIKTIPIEEAEVAGTRVLYHPLATNSIVYLDLGFDLRSLPANALPYLTIFGRALLEMGTRAEDYIRLTQRIGRSTGGIWPRDFISAARGVRAMAPGPAWLFLRARAVTANVPEMLAILHDVLLQPRLDDRERLRQILLEEKARREAGLIRAGNSMVTGRISAHYTEDGWLDDQLSYFGGLFAVRSLVEELEREPQAVTARLEAMRASLVARPAMLANVTLDPAARDRFAPALGEFLSQIPGGSPTVVSWPRPEYPANEAFSVPSQVNYVGKGADLYALGYRLSGSTLVVNGYLNSTFLWEKIRAQGGAYGGSAQFDHLSGTYIYASYRDPNLLGTLDNYDAAPDFLRHADLTDTEVTKAIIRAIGRLDAYQLPSAKGFTSMARYLTGQTDEFRQQLRDEVLGTTPQDFRSFADVLDGVRRNGQVVVMGPEDALRTAAEQRKGLWSSVTKVL